MGLIYLKNASLATSKSLFSGSGVAAWCHIAAVMTKVVEAGIGFVVDVVVGLVAEHRKFAVGGY